MELQILFKRFQSRETRKVLGESNLPYSGLTSDLEDIVNSNQISHRHPFDYSTCIWQTPLTEEIDVISSWPSREEISRKLSKLKNTSPGKDKLEYIHIKSIDKRCILMYEILKAVYSVGKPMSWVNSVGILMESE